ncbi:MAG: hypothetical protein ACXWUG_19850 [Polyangiales bacterium]
MKWLPCFVLLAACSSESPAKTSDPEADSATVETSVEDATEEALGEPSSDAAGETSIPRNCPACEATKCSAALMACGGNSDCLNWLVCMNECFKKPGVSACQNKCTASMPTKEGAALTACKKEKCVAECTPLD